MGTISNGPDRAAVNKLRATAALIVVVNLFPLFGVAFLGWDLFHVLTLFWLENVIIGLFGILRIVFSNKGRRRLFDPVFFLLHYGGFMAGHGYIILTIYAKQFDDRANAGYYLPQLLEQFNAFAAAALFVSHAWSFFSHFLGSAEAERLDPREAMALPYRRMVITHVALLVGSMFLLKSGQPVAGVLLLIALKIALDVNFHIKEHRQLMPALA